MNKIYKAVAITILAFAIQGCNKDDLWKCWAKTTCDINGVVYEDHQSTPLTPDYGNITPYMWYDKSDSTITFRTDCSPTKNDKSLHSYDIELKFFNKALAVGEKYEVFSSSIPPKKISDYYDASWYYMSKGISYVSVTDDNTYEFNFGDGYITITSEKDKDIYGDINIKVKLPIENIDSTLNIKGTFRATLDLK
jgi:hypothetical protein